MNEKSNKQILVDLWDKRNKDESDWVRSALTVVAIIIGIIISF